MHGEGFAQDPLWRYPKAYLPPNVPDLRSEGDSSVNMVESLADPGPNEFFVIANAKLLRLMPGFEESLRTVRQHYLRGARGNHRQARENEHKDAKWLSGYQSSLASFANFDRC